ncbi:ABC transporter ATP-binding protein [Bacillus gobiensis]
MIQIRNVSYSYHNKRVLNNINLSIEKGEFVLILGPSGGGKTTLCQAVNGIIPNDIKGTEFIGEVTIDGRSTINQSIGLAGCEVGTVLQDPEWQFVNGTVIEELTFTMENHGLTICEMEKRLTEVVEQLNIGHLLHESPSTLSGGQKQRVAIAASLVMNPKILVLDEPTAELDPIGKKSILELIKTLNLQFGITVLFVDHNLDITFPYADRVFVVANGEIIADEKPDFPAPLCPIIATKSRFFISKLISFKVSSSDFLYLKNTFSNFTARSLLFVVSS